MNRLFRYDRAPKWSLSAKARHAVALAYDEHFPFKYAIGPPLNPFLLLDNPPPPPPPGGRGAGVIPKNRDFVDARGDV